MDNGNCEYGVYVSASLGVAAGSTGAIGGVELGFGRGNLDDFGGWGLATGGYTPIGSIEFTSPGDDNITYSGNPLLSKSFSSG